MKQSSQSLNLFLVWKVKGKKKVKKGENKMRHLNSMKKTSINGSQEEYCTDSH